MKDFRSQYMACFMGKSIGGTLGMPYEGLQQELDLDYYRPVPEFALPNDDLDLQLVWLQHVKEYGLSLDSQKLGQAWLDHIDGHPDEYGIAIWNLRRGLKPPLTGKHNNWFTHGMGAAIRSEIWASLFPGQPNVAAWFAWQDAQVDHDGEGIYAEIFLAAMQSDLYESQNLAHAIACGLSFLPEASTLKQAMLELIANHKQGMSCQGAHAHAKAQWGHYNFTDCVMNLSWIMLGLLYGQQDFERSLLIAVNCGQDTDCTGATVGATLGILLGEGGIPKRWHQPLGRDIFVGHYILNLPAPATLDELIHDIHGLSKKLSAEQAPQLSAPFEIPVAEDKVDAWPWRLDDQSITTNGLWIPVSDHVPVMRERVKLQSVLVSPRTQPAQLMIASTGIFRCLIDGKNQGVWAARTPVVPSPHRLTGGRVYNFQLKANQPHQIEIELYPTWPTPDVLVAVTDMENRYLTQVNWQDAALREVPVEVDLVSAR